MKKRCRVCGKRRLRKFFYKNATMADGLQSECKDCERAYQRRYHYGHKTKAKYRATRERTRLRLQYGITPELREEMRKKQKGKCAICGRRMKKPSVDHEHKTRKVRGLLCDHCNRMLGFARESIKTLKSAIGYLTRSATPKESHLLEDPTFSS